MGIRDSTRDRSHARAASQLSRLRADLETARRNAGLSYDGIGLACGRDGSTIARIVAGSTQAPALRDLFCIAAALGPELGLRAFPGDDALRDIAHVRLLERLRAELAPGLGWRTEVPVTADPADRRAWDALIVGAGWRFAVEAETVIHDLQDLDRRLTLKQRDGGVDGLIVLVADTRRNRRALHAAPA